MAEASKTPDLFKGPESQMEVQEKPGPISSSKTSSSSSSSSSSGSSSGSSSSDSSSSGSSSSSDSDSDDGQQPKTGSNNTPNTSSKILKKTPSNSSNDAHNTPSTSTQASSNKKLVASGTVVNDKIRVVPIKARKKVRKADQSPLDRKELQNDPNFVCHSNSNLSESSLTEEGDEKRRSLRRRSGGTPILNEKYIFRLQHELFLQNENNRQKQEKSKKVKAKEKKIKTPKKEDIDADTPISYLRKSGRVADWDDFLKEDDNYTWVAPVTFFKHAPCSSIWTTLALTRMKIEIPNPFVICNRQVYWVATIHAFAGYKALVEFESFGAVPGYFAWMSFCSSVPKPLGYCDEHYILLFPPEEVYNEHKDFLEKIRTALGQECRDGLQTVSGNHSNIIFNEVMACRLFKLSQVVEALDCSNTAQNRVANITGIVGDRVHVTYCGKPDYDTGFWFNVKSPQLHTIGWSHSVGHKLVGVPKGVRFPEFKVEDFPKYPESIQIKTGMVFEVIHPIHVHLIVPARVSEVLKHGYFMAEMNGDSLEMNITFCFHITSPWLLPIGFCERNNISLTIPYGESKETFNWDDYCLKKQVVPLDFSPLPEKPGNQFTTGCKMEAIDIRQPTFCGPVTVKKIAEHLLLIHFDGWKLDFSSALQWVDCQSTELYPAGWAECVGHEYGSHPSAPLPEDRCAVIENVRAEGSEVAGS